MAGQILVDHVDAHFLGAPVVIAEAGHEIVHQEGHIGPDAVVEGAKLFRAVGLDRQAKVFVVQERVQGLVLEMAGIPFAQGGEELGFHGRPAGDLDLLRQGAAGVFLLNLAAKIASLIFGGVLAQQVVFDALEQRFVDQEAVTGEAADHLRARLEVDGEHIVLDVAADLLFVVVVERFLDFLQHGVVVHPEQGGEQPLGQLFPQILAHPGKVGVQGGHVDQTVLPGIGRVKFVEDLDAVPAGKAGAALVGRFGDDLAAALGGQVLAVFGIEPFGRCGRCRSPS